MYPCILMDSSAAQWASCISCHLFVTFSDINTHTFLSIIITGGDCIWLLVLCISCLVLLLYSIFLASLRSTVLHGIHNFEASQKITGFEGIALFVPNSISELCMIILKWFVFAVCLCLSITSDWYCMCCIIVSFGRLSSAYVSVISA